jgi:hypothetical protein
MFLTGHAMRTRLNLFWSQELGPHLYPESATVDATDRPKWEAYR